jgi:hypothetical protein
MRRAGLAERIDAVEHRMDSMEQRLDASFNALSTRILQSNAETREAILATLRGEVAGEFSAMRARSDRLETAIADLRGEMTAQGTDMRGEMKAETADLRLAIREGDEETRRFMLILHEETLSKIALLAEGGRSQA